MKRLCLVLYYGKCGSEAAFEWLELPPPFLSVAIKRSGITFQESGFFLPLLLSDKGEERAAENQRGENGEVG